MSNKNIKPLPTQEYLLECFRLDELTGVLYWKKRPSYHFISEYQKKIFIKKIDTRVGSLNQRGYLEQWIIVDGVRQRYLVHRLIWKLYYGEDPIELIDHVDNNKINNRIENLRECNNKQNIHNNKKRVNNTSGYKGVCWVKDKQKFKARIKVDGKDLHLGYFDNPEEAHKVYCEASIKHHKEFSNFG